ncbi:conserved hypothetical protein [Photorhabdus asymbiotica]|uniref:Uncharacterized protein n=2 Tax=Photorhabdus asymbiotica TaxID=291112 RepID=C7BK42_PHOAA|nr:hypothetical protein BDD30_0103 [Photorhabdus asymbiotica]CAQ84282.1 conserved hypothetical protein [Photorhabdus asymbiotica]
MTNASEVGGTEINSKSITTDYDLFSIFPSLDFMKIKSVNGQDEDVNMGNLHYFGKVIINSLNQEINNEGYLCYCNFNFKISSHSLKLKCRSLSPRYSTRTEVTKIL